MSKEKKKEVLYWYRLKKGGNYHVFKRTNGVYPFEPITYCKIYAKSVIEKTQSKNPRVYNCCRKCIKELEEAGRL